MQGSKRNMQGLEANNHQIKKSAGKMQKSILDSATKIAFLYILTFISNRGQYKI